jgi:mannose-6-phosphate isomerase-like protein (cupin superfamily)
MYNIEGERGGHKHKKTIQALIAIHGSCRVVIRNEDKRETYLLDSPDKCLIVEPKDWHTMDNFSSDGVLLVLASEYYDADDYIRRYK